MHTKIETKQPKPRLLFVMVIRWLIIGENKLLNKEHMHFGCNTVNQQILAAIKFGVSQNKVIWRLLNLASPRSPSMQCTIDVYFGSENTQFAKYNSTPKFVDLQ